MPTREQIEANAARTGNARVLSTLSGTARQARRRASAPILNQGLNSAAHFCPSVTPRRRPPHCSGTGPPPEGPHGCAATGLQVAACCQCSTARLACLERFGGSTLRSGPPCNQQRKLCSTRPEPAARWAPVFLRHWHLAGLNGRFMTSCRRPADCTPPATKAAGGREPRTLSHTQAHNARLS